MKTTLPGRQKAFSTVELMIAMVLGLMVVGAIGGLFVQHKTNYRQNEQLALMQENGRYALNLLASDLATAGFWGGADCTDLGNCHPETAVSVTNDCNTNWAVPAATQAPSPYPTMQYLLPSSSTSAPNGLSDLSCFGDSDYVKPGTNVLSLKHVEGNPVYCRSDEDDDEDNDEDDFPGFVFLQTSGSSGTLIKSPVPPDCPALSTDPAFWKYLIHIYYIDTELSPATCATKPNDGRCIPRLMRKTLTRESEIPKLEDESGDLAEGIEYFHIEFGIDGSNVSGECQAADGIPDRYVSSTTDFAAIAASDLDCAISARIHVLVRSAESDSSYTDNNKTYTFGTGDGAVTRTFNDHFRRKVFTTTVQLRNQQYH